MTVVMVINLMSELEVLGERLGICKVYSPALTILGVGLLFLVVLYWLKT